jgi:hypothetical protein
VVPVVAQGLVDRPEEVVVATTRILAPVDQVDLQVAVAMGIRILAPAEGNPEEGLGKGASTQRPWFDIQTAALSVRRTPAVATSQP